MDTATLNKTFSAVVRQVAKRLEIEIEAEFNLRTSRQQLRDIAARGKSWTLFVNKKGDKALAVDRKGAIMILPETPEYLHNLQHPEHAINWFVNEMRDRMKSFYKKGETI